MGRKAFKRAAILRQKNSRSLGGNRESGPIANYLINWRLCVCLNHYFFIVITNTSQKFTAPNAEFAF
jgi:hypothetical protein